MTHRTRRPAIQSPIQSPVQSPVQSPLRLAARFAARFAIRAGISLVAVGIALTIVAPPGDAQQGGPTKHFSVGAPAELSDDDAERIYRRVVEALAKGYRLSNDKTARAYRGWTRFNAAPYRSANHGERFVNHYANALARSYGAFERAGDLPVGAVVAKDSFAVTADGGVFSGPLFVMEKMAEGFNPRSRDWRFSMIMPDGSLFGATKGAGARNVEFCVACHRKAGAGNDFLYFVPPAYR